MKGGTTRRVPFSLATSGGETPASVEALLTYALIPQPSPALKSKYLATLPNDKDREAAAKLIEEYAQPRVLTFRTKTLSSS